MLEEAELNGPPFTDEAYGLQCTTGITILPALRVSKWTPLLALPLSSITFNYKANSVSISSSFQSSFSLKYHGFITHLMNIIIIHKPTADVKAEIPFLLQRSIVKLWLF